MERQWYKGDTHLHTLNSDGRLTKSQLIYNCKKIGLDFMIITDHNYNTIDETYFDEDILVIQGQELTDKPGHVNVWGEGVPSEPPHKLDTAEDYKVLIDKCKKAGATVSLNHPFCSNCPFLLDMEAFDFDCVEVWNTIQHSDNVKNMKWWSEQLLKGNRIGAVGGSDYHRDYVKIPLLAIPTTYVLAESKTKEDILKAMREGRSVVTNSPKSSMIYLTVGEAQLGDTVKLKDNNKAQISVTGLKKGHQVIVYNNNKVIFRHKAMQRVDKFTAEFDIKESGFIRAEVTYKLNPLLEKLQAFAERTFMSSHGADADISSDMPDFFWAFTNPIWIEE